jgi:hypothetical protein
MVRPRQVTLCMKNVLKREMAYTKMKKIPRKG